MAANVADLVAVPPVQDAPSGMPAPASAENAPLAVVVAPSFVRQLNVIQEGTSVLLDVNGEKTSFAVVKKTMKVRVGKNLVSLEPLIGLPFGSKFEVRTGPNTAELVRAPPGSTGEKAAGEDPAEEGQTEKEATLSNLREKKEVKVAGVPAGAKKDNRSLVDNNTAQALSKEDVEELRRQGLSGQEIIQALVANSATFHGKTEFSQEKYLKKKQKKYAPQLTVRRPSGRSVCEAYFNKNPEKTCNLRPDSLAFLLAMSNVSAYHDVLVFEGCGGLVTAAVAERLGGHGTVCSAYKGPRPDSIDIARNFNFNQATANSIMRASLQSLVDRRAAEGAQEETKAGTNDGGVGSKSAVSLMEVDEKHSSSGKAEEEATVNGWRNLGVGIESENEEKLQTEVSGPEVSGEGPVEEGDGSGWRGLGVGEEATASEAGPSSKAAERKARRDEQRRTKGGNKLGAAASEEQLRTWGSQGFTSLVVAAPAFQPQAVAAVLLPLLAPSSSFAFYHTALQPLAECMHWLQVNRKGVALQLGEPWLREYQVLPARTHPHMQMSATGGYVLSGITVVEDEGAREETTNTEETGNKRKRGKFPPRGGKRGRGR